MTCPSGGPSSEPLASEAAIEVALPMPGRMPPILLFRAWLFFHDLFFIEIAA